MLFDEQELKDLTAKCYFAMQEHSMNVFGFSFSASCRGNKKLACWFDNLSTMLDKQSNKMFGKWR